MAKDPYRYFRVEARELLEGLSQGVLQLEKEAAPEVIGRLLRLAHTLKGAARVVRQPAIAQVAHSIEDVLTAHRGTGEPLAGPKASELLKLLDGIASAVDALDPAREAAAVQPEHTPAAAEQPESFRIETDQMDALLEGVVEVGVRIGAVRAGLDTSSRLRDLTAGLLDELALRPGESLADGAAGIRARSVTAAEALRAEVGRLRRELDTSLERVEGEVGRIREIAHRLRLIPAQTAFPALDRAVRDAAQSLQKRAELQTSGGDVRLDANVLAPLRDALSHVVRNAVTHGIESESDRLALGKPPVGVVRLTVERRGSRVVFVCQDDGRGIDIAAVRTAAVARGLVAADAAATLSAEGVLNLLRQGGVSTSGAVTELSGRGIGLDVVRATVAGLKGRLQLRSEPGRGAAVEIDVPISIASVQGLVVEAGGATAAIPLDAVRETLRIGEQDIVRSAEAESVLHDGKTIPLLHLDRALRIPGVRRTRRARSAVVIEAGSRRIALGVDRLLGTAALVARSLPVLVDADPIVSGATLDAEGNPQLVLDPQGLVDAAHLRVETAADADSEPKLPVLVIDDSLTTRMLEKSILESAGYVVDIAVSAEDGIAKAHERGHLVFIVDVEMPGMDGFEFVTRTRADPALRNTPAILVTSRNAPEDKRKGELAGAGAYIVKSEFDQKHLLETIRKLVA